MNVLYLVRGSLSIKYKIRFLYVYVLLFVFYPLRHLLHTNTIHLFKFTLKSFDNRNLYNLFGEIFVQGVYFFKTDKKNPIIVDCGSNIGLSVFYFKYLYPRCKLYAFEPDFVTYKMLKQNIQRNQLSSVKIFNYAITNKRGKIPFYIDAQPGSLAMSTTKVFDLHKNCMVKTISLSEVLPNDIQIIDFIKVDIEGSEFIFLKDLIYRNIIYKIKEMIIEYHHNYSRENGTLGSFLALLDKSGFNYQLDVPVESLYRRDSFQCVHIYAYNRKLCEKH